MPYGFTHKTRPKRPGIQPDPRLAAMGRVLAAQGIGEDDLVAHINRREARLLARLGGAGTRNPRTGLLQFDDTDESETPEEEATPAPPETPQPISDDQLQAQADATLRRIGPIPTSQPGPVGWREQAQGIRRGVEDYLSEGAMNLSRMRTDINRGLQDFRADPAKTLERLGPTFDGIAPGLEALPRAAAGALRTIRLIGRVPNPNAGPQAERAPDAAGSAAGTETATDAPQIGPFGPILTEHQGDWRNAALALEGMQSGEAVGALSHPDVGPISLVWGKEGTGGSDGYGLSKLIAWHPEILQDLQGAMTNMEVKSRSPNRIRLESPDHAASVRLDWQGDSRTWLLTAYDKGVPRRTEKFTGRLGDILGDQPLPPLR